MSRLNPCAALKAWKEIVVPQLAKAEQLQDGAVKPAPCCDHKDVIAALAQIQQTLLAAAQQQTRPALTRGLTQLIPSYPDFTGGTTVQIVPANPQRRFLLIAGASQQAWYSVDPGQLETNTIGITVNASFGATGALTYLLIDENTWGAWVQLAWFGKPNGPTFTPPLVLEEVYISSPVAQPAWTQPSLAAQAPTAPTIEQTTVDIAPETLHQQTPTKLNFETGQWESKFIDQPQATPSLSESPPSS